MPTIGTKTLALGLAVTLVGCSPANSGTNDSAAEAGDQTAQAAPDLDAARRLVDAIYTPYAKGEVGDPTGHFATDLTAAYDSRGEEGLGADPFCDCQDYDQFSYQIQAVEPSADGAVARVGISNFGTPSVIVLHLVEQGGAWKVADVGEGETSLMRTLSQPAG